MNEIQKIDSETGEIQSLSLMNPRGAIARAREAKAARDEFIREILNEGIDYGYPPGTEPKTDEDKKHRKPSLFKGGAEKITDGYNLRPNYTPLDCIEDWENRLWVYRYKCDLVVRGTDTIVASGIGSCNSRESKYAFREGKRVCPSCGAAAIIAGKKEYGGGWLCFAKKGGCGAKFKVDDPEIANQAVGRSANEDIADLVNTIDKMAQKRAFVAANLCLGFSAVFTQDIEDNPSAYGFEPKGQVIDRGGVIEERDAGAPAPAPSAVTQAKKDEPKKTAPDFVGSMIAKIEGKGTIELLNAGKAAWDKFDKPKLTADQIEQINNAIANQKLKLLNEAEANAPIKDAEFNELLNTPNPPKSDDPPFIDIDEIRERIYKAGSLDEIKTLRRSFAFHATKFDGKKVKAYAVEFNKVQAEFEKGQA